MPDGELVQAIQEEEAAENELLAETAPTGKFSATSMSRLMRAAEAFAEVAQGVDVQLGEPEATTDKLGNESVAFPPQLVRVLSMAEQMVEDAIAANVLAPEMALSMDGVSSDTQLAMLAGRLEEAARDRGFLRWLQEPPDEPEVQEEAPVEEAPVEDENPEAYLASRA